MEAPVKHICSTNTKLSVGFLYVEEIKKAIGKKYILCRRYIAVDMVHESREKKQTLEQNKKDQRCYHRHEEGI